MVKTVIRVISIDTAIERRETFKKTASLTDVTWDFFPACTGAVEPLILDEDLMLSNTGRLLSRGEIGCYASHFKVLEWFMASDFDQLIVFEDDVIVDWGAIRKLLNYNLSQLGIEFLKLYATHPFFYSISKYRFLSDHSHLVRTRGMIFGTQAYVISRRGAEVLLSRSQIISMPIDWQMMRYWEFGFGIYCLFPFPVIERYVPSSIGASRYDAAGSLSIKNRFSRFKWRARGRFMRYLFDIKFREIGSFRNTRDTGSIFLDFHSDK